MHHNQEFQFQDPGELVDGDLTLSLEEKSPANSDRQWVPSYKFAMRIEGTIGPVGTVNFRAVVTEKLRNVGGSIGYKVDEQFRGHRLAERSCRLLLPFIKNHGFSELWITCNPENIASRKTCERLGALLVNIVDVPLDSDMYERGERKVCRYRLDLKE